MTKKHKELLALAQTRSKELNDFLESKGDNISAQDLAKAHEIRDDLKRIKTEIEAEKQIDTQRGAVGKELSEFRAWMENPAGSPKIHRGVIGSQPDGYVDVLPKSRAVQRAARLLRSVKMHGDWNPKAFEAAATPEYTRSFYRYLTHGNQCGPKHLRNLEEGLDPQGGYLAPVEVIAKLIQKKPTPTRVQGLVDVINSSRDAVSLPRVNYTTTAADDPNGYIYNTGFRATLTDENPTSSTQALVNDTNLFGSVRVSVYTWMIEGVLTNNQVEDSMFDPAAWMTEKFGLTIDLLKDNMIINGSGVSQPVGLLANPGATDILTYPATIALGAPAAPYITADGLITLTEGIPEQYDENIKYLYQKTTTGVTIRTLKDANGRYLFSRGIGDDTIVVGRQQSLNGYPVLLSQFMPAPAASGSGLYPVIAGDFGGFTLVNRVGFSIQVLREIAARQNQLVILGRVRFGGQPLEPWRLRVGVVGAAGTGSSGL